MPRIDDLTFTNLSLFTVLFYQATQGPGNVQFMAERCSICEVTSQLIRN